MSVVDAVSLEPVGKAWRIDIDTQYKAERYYDTVSI